MNKDITTSKKAIADEIRKTISILNDLIKDASEIKLEVLLPKYYSQKIGSEIFSDPIVQERIKY